jgi:hypothetical protein
MERAHLNENDANQGAQSKGEFLGMTGNSGWWLLGSAGASIMIVILFWGVLGFPLLLCLLVGVVLCVASVAYVFALKNNKPAHYDTDFFESALIEAGVMELAFGPRARRPSNPFRGAVHEAPLHDPSPRRPERARFAASGARPAATEDCAKRTAAARTAAVRKQLETPPEPVVPLAAYESLREELDTAEDLLEDALVERGEN